MARTDDRLRGEIAQERAELVAAVKTLRAAVADATNVSAKLRTKLPLVAVGALGLGFVSSGGIGATARLLMRKSREGDEKARAGRFSLVDRS
ncbi:MAG TPA: hypothetical protein VFA30_09940 [Gaiellaceae bacterium]|nr:hypothetical protein [Gaiellaceae bacterium]